MYSFYEFLFVSIVFMMKQMLSVLLLNVMKITKLPSSRITLRNFNVSQTGSQFYFDSTETNFYSFI